MKVYISGAISCLPKEEYVNRFERVENYLLSQGYTEIVNPTKIKPYNNIPIWENYMRSCLEQMMSCDIIFVILQDYYKSKGVIEELRLAKLLGIEVKNINLEEI